MSSALSDEADAYIQCFSEWESALAKFSPDGKMPYILFWMTQSANNIISIDDLYEELSYNTLMFHNDESETAKRSIQKSIEYVNDYNNVAWIIYPNSQCFSSNQNLDKPVLFAKLIFNAFTQ